MNDAISQQRRAIDRSDLELVELLNRRARQVSELARLKRALDLPVADPRREQSVLDSVSQANRGPLDTRGMHNIFSVILSESRRLQREWQKEETCTV